MQRVQTPLHSDQRTWEEHLQSTALDDGGALAVADGAGLGAGGLERLDDVEGVGVGDLAEDDVAAVEPRGDNGGDEELRAVAEAGLALEGGRQRGRSAAFAYVLGPALAMDSRPGFSCFSWKFSSANFSP
jgi:hypothetical protein